MQIAPANPASQAITDQQRLHQIATHAQETLLAAEAVFPFQLFPDSIVLDRTKVTLHKRIFFGATDDISVQIEDILNVGVDAGPFFATLKIFTRIPYVDPLTIHNLRRQEALDFQGVIEGYVIARAEKIDCSSINKYELLVLLRRLGHESSTYSGV